MTSTCSFSVDNAKTRPTLLYHYVRNCLCVLRDFVEVTKVSAFFAKLNTVVGLKETFVCITRESLFHLNGLSYLDGFVLFGWFNLFCVYVMAGGSLFFLFFDGIDFLKLLFVLIFD